MRCVQIDRKMSSTVELPSTRERMKPSFVLKGSEYTSMPRFRMGIRVDTPHPTTNAVNPVIAPRTPSRLARADDDP